jgi:Carboxypeptidase regulatory-like domain
LSTGLTFLSRIFFTISFVSIEKTTLCILAYSLLTNWRNWRDVSMGIEETRHDLWLKRINTWIAILGSSVASVVGVYNFSPTSFFAPATGDISAFVRTQSGTPVSRAHVELLTSQNVLLGASETDRDGRYLKKELEAGSYTLKVTRGGFEPQIATVNVASKKTTDLELVLRSRSRAQAPSSLQASGGSQAPAAPQAPGSPIRSALEEAGASWIRNLGK